MSNTRPVSTPAQARLCRCGAVVLEGLAEGVPVRADAAALNADGELDALAAGRRSYVLNRRELVLRDTTRLNLPGPVVADHRCGQPVPAAHRAPPAPSATTRRPRPLDPPY
ncbi:hypothetical protein [Stackebrandtia nassauensis]|uniref:Uncharacterized protein n=1 Tax=Stackebrandtia nassauensis (strain DSM 44728 / CIP 108903 / NRRL B-16338 / NBRC 102104 / LLR-40K-21) TaxID=446470 RepID=D3Q2D0_STANL|nr:hypothetical protein [Stackebrandtia nassauensis]ADD43863.1 hypothetical protein Snas_4214 [Stackebrandtia nassauensis DSM 44728]